jgi:hypothetical protein
MSEEVGVVLITLVRVKVGVIVMFFVALTHTYDSALSRTKSNDVLAVKELRA